MIDHTLNPPGSGSQQRTYSNPDSHGTIFYMLHVGYQSSVMSRLIEIEKNSGYPTPQLRCKSVIFQESEEMESEARDACKE